MSRYPQVSNLSHTAIQGLVNQHFAKLVNLSALFVRTKMQIDAFFLIKIKWILTMKPGSILMRKYIIVSTIELNFM